MRLGIKTYFIRGSMHIVLSITAPIFLLIFLGYSAVKWQLLPQTILPSLGRFVLYFSLPSLIFTKLQSMVLSEAIDLNFLLIYWGAGLLSLILAVGLSRLLMKSDWQRAGVIGLGACMPNSSFIGLPLLLQVFDHAPTQAFVMVLMVENILLMPSALILIETISHHGNQSFYSKALSLIKRVLSNPIILAVLLGVGVSIADLPVPHFVMQSLTLLGDSAAPLALVVIGGGLVGVVIKGTWPSLALVASMKLLVFPLLVLGFLMFTPHMANELKVALIVFSAMPMLSIYPIVGGQYKANSFCASSLLITTLLSFITLNVLLVFII